MNMIEKLLKADAGKLTQLPTKTIEIKRLSEELGEKFEVQLKAISHARHCEIQENAVDISKKGDIKGIKISGMQIMTVLEGLKEPSLKDKALLDHFAAETPKELLTKLFLGGEIAEMYKQINELSGYDSDDEAVNEEIKN